MDQEKDMADLRKSFDAFTDSMERRFKEFCDDCEKRIDRYHAENRVRLQSIDRAVAEVATGIARMQVKTDFLYGDGSKPGAVESLTKTVNQLGVKMAWAAGFLAAVITIVGWAIEAKR